MKCLNIFCDASITSGFTSYNPSYACSGSIAIYNNIIIDKTLKFINNSTTNNYAEITAVLLAVNQALKYRNQFDIISIFSDSKLCIYGLREWLFKWVYKNNILYNSSNVPVANQEVFKNIANMILRNNLIVNLYHVRGHTANTPTALVKQQEMFKRSNNIDISYETAQYISHWNEEIDKETGEGLNQIQPILYASGYINPGYFSMEEFDYEKYKKLLDQNYGIGDVF